MYKDKEKQKEAVRKAVAKHRMKGITSPEGITRVLHQGITQPKVSPKPNESVTIHNDLVAEKKVKALEALAGKGRLPYALCDKCGRINLNCRCNPLKKRGKNAHIIGLRSNTL